MPGSNQEVYATQARPLRDQISGLLRRVTPEPISGEIYSIVVPDANLLAGGAAAAAVYRRLEGRTYDTVVLVGPSHTGEFGRISICSIDEYRTPLGELTVNDQVRNELCDEDDDIFLDDRGHFHQEGIDVQLPFLQTVLKGAFDIVPIVMGEESPDFCRELGHAIGEMMFSRRVLVVASADIDRADPAGLETFREYFEGGDVSRLMSLLNSETVRIDGRGPVLVALIAALHRRADRVRIVEMCAPKNGIPGFLGAVIWRD